jgi:chemotaxis-related protein WspB
MLFLLFELDGNRYALEVGQVAEALPYLNPRPIHGAPQGIAGMIDHGGAPVPVVDLSRVLAGRPAVLRFSTRIVLVHYGPSTGEPRLLGLIAEHATETIRRRPDEFRDSGVTNATAPHVGRVLLEAAGPLHWLDVNRLLPDALSTSLFRQVAGS